LTAPGLDQLTAPRGWQGLKIEQAAPALKAYLAGLQSQPDLLIVLSHLGVSDDEALAEAVPRLILSSAATVIPCCRKPAG
jgi:2',3'-cyclic-nucleotide 2'-phosphodiesterase (5'-nucleotidase family)